MRSIHAIILAGALVFSVPIIGHSAQQSSESLSASDQAFLQKLASEDMSEIQLARLALQRSSNPQVQTYANTILQADPSMKQQATVIAQQHGVKIPQDVSSTQTAEYNRLAKLSGDAFDRAYMQYEAQKQQQDLDLVQQVARTTQNTTIRDYANNEEVPVLKAADMAKTIANSMNASPGSEKPEP